MSEAEDRPPGASPVLPSRAADLFALLREADQPPPAEIASPAVAEALPPLMPSCPTGGVAPPIAAELTRAGARAEATVLEDDLATLAAKVKRILDEEARRYGIEV